MTFPIWATALILSLVVNGLAQRAMAVDGVGTGISLVYRGLVCLACVVVFARRQGLSLRPRAPRTQLFRALIAGLALSLFTLSYNWLTASAVSVLSNVDVPMLILLGPLVGVRATGSARVLSVLSVGCLVYFVASLEAQPNLALGLAFLGIGTLLLCFGYFFIKKSMGEENEAVTILTPALAIIVYGGLQALFLESARPPFSWELAGQSVLAGGGMFGAYYATMRLYERTDLATAEFQTLLASIVIQPFEWFFLREPLEFAYVVSAVAFVAFTYVVLRLQNRAAA